jgi:cation diffusion facilitator CzcD-associated flavoprotein CzcO
VYAGSGEIFNYFDQFSKKYGLRKDCQTERKVVGATWNNEKGGYDVVVEDTVSGEKTHDYCDILINASGILNAWRWPAIPGLDKYEGTLLHTANWDPSIDLSGKHVGLIGNGSSGIQVLPTIQPKVPKVTTFIREPTWVSPVQGLEQHVFSPQELHDFEHKPGALLAYRKEIEEGLNGQFALFLRGTQKNQETRDYMLGQMKKKLNNKFLEEKLIPDWSLGCRRLTPGVGYLESLTKDNVEVVYGEINEITAKGCLCDNGQEYPVDVLICATGFDTTFKPRFPLIGPSGSNLQDQWAQEPRSYLGLAAADFPNYLIFLGPNCPIGNGPVLSAIEAQADWMMAVIDRYQTSNIHSICPKREAVDDFLDWKNDFMKGTVWADSCRSWYKANQADAPVTALWPGSTVHYIEALSEVRWEDMEVKYNGNRYGWLGSGFSQCESDDTADWAYYIREHDDQEYQSKGKRREILTKSGTVSGRTAVNFVGVQPEQARL